MDDTFNDSVEKMQMMHRIHNNVGPFNFWAYGRLDLLSAKPEMLELVGEIGWKYFDFGIETWNRNAGKKIGKGADPEKLKSTLKQIKKQYPESWLLFEMIVGLPGDTIETIEDTYQWFAENEDLWDEIHFKELFIANKEYQKWNSAMSLNPEKFGIKIISFYGGEVDRKYTLHWQHGDMDVVKARKIATDLHNRIYKDNPRDRRNYFLDLARNKYPFLKLFEGEQLADMFRSFLRSRARNYVNLKFKYRGIRLEN